MRYLLQPQEQISSERKIGVNKYRISAHFLEQKLKYGKKGAASGIKLTPPEDRIIHALMNLLKKKEVEHHNSDVIVESMSYGDQNPQKCNFMIITCTEKEILNQVYGEKKHSGTHIKRFRKTFIQLAGRKFVIQYKKTFISKNNKKESCIINEKRNLIKIHSTIPAEKIKTPLTYQIVLHPILTDQIDTKYVSFSECIHEKTLHASERVVADATIRLRDYLLSEISAGRYNVQINQENLIYRLHLEKYLFGRNKNKALHQISKSIEVCIKIRLVSKVEETIGAKGQKKYVFKLQNPY